MKARELTYMEKRLYEPKWYEVARAIIGNVLLFLAIGAMGYIEVMW